VTFSGANRAAWITALRLRLTWTHSARKWSSASRASTNYQVSIAKLIPTN